MALFKKPMFDPQRKSLLRVAKPMKVGTGQSRVNLLTKHELEEYARANPGPGPIEKISDGIKGFFKKLTKAS
jgi:hypothetical protein